jgi:membrane carboxypeptidase/penicillin-binding protein
MGIESTLDAVPSLALGAGEVSPLELARAYATLANGGDRVAVRPLFHVTDDDGESLLDVSRRARARVRSRRGRARALRARRRGEPRHRVPAAPTRLPRPVAGKTGTTNDARDAWFVGFTPELVAAVWVGFDDGTPLGLTGAQAALPIFGRFLIGALGPNGGEDFAVPPGLERVAINESTGLRASFFCWGDDEWFLAGTAPGESCGPASRDEDERFEPRARIAARARPAPPAPRSVLGDFSTRSRGIFARRARRRRATAVEGGSCARPRPLASLTRSAASASGGEVHRHRAAERRARGDPVAIGDERSASGT